MTRLRELLRISTFSSLGSFEKVVGLGTWLLLGPLSMLFELDAMVVALVAAVC